MKLSDKNKKILYIVFYSALFIYLAYMLISNRETILKNISGEGDKIRNTLIVKNYKFKDTITFKDEYGKESKVIDLDGQVYGKKSLIITKENDIEKEYYTDGKLLYIKDETKFKIHDGKIVDNIDLKLLDLDYLSSLLGSAVEEERSINSLTLYNKIGNVRTHLTFDMNKDLDIITVEKDNYSIKMKIYDNDLVKDFNPIED